MNDIINGLPAGTVLSGKAYQYRIEKTLGQGSFGITYLATVKIKGPLGALDFSVAVKEFFMHDLNGRNGTAVTSGSEHGLFEDYRRKFVREASNLSRLKHPNIVKVLEEFETNGTVYYAMDYINGGSLDDLIARKGRLSEEECVKYAREICSALQFMHKSGMLHLDLKPLNIMLRDGHAVLIDFGLSKQYNENGEPESSTKVGAGTPGYAPIEQADYRDGKGFPVTMDVYALGGTIFKMLTGHRPPEASLVLNDGFPSDELQGLGVTPWLIELTEKCMSPTHKGRYQSAAEVLAALDRHAPTGEETIVGDDEPIVAEVVEPVPIIARQEAAPTPEKRKSHTAAISIVVACLVAIGIGAAFLLKPKHTPSDSELALVDTEAMDSMTIPDQLVSEVVEPEEQDPIQETQATTQQTQTSKPVSGTINGHEWVDLGLSVKWATCNVGASSPEGYGNYYAWGEITTKSSYTKENSKTYNVSMGSIAGNPKFDAARANWGSTWRLPTKAETEELMNKCRWALTTMGGHKGYKLTGPSGNSIFLPAAGFRYETELCFEGEQSIYWSASPCDEEDVAVMCAYQVYLDDGGFSFYFEYAYRYLGRTVRPVSD